MTMHNELWFPTVIWSSILNSIEPVSLKKYAYELKKAEPAQSALNHGGYSSPTLQPGSNYQIDKLIDTVNSEVDNCRKQVKIGELMLYDIWLNINPPGSYIKSRVHPGACFAGMFVVDGAKKGGNIQFERTDRGEYHIPTHIEENNYYNATHAQYSAKRGALYIWPGWLRYNVEGNQGNTDQISIGFMYGEKV